VSAVSRAPGFGLCLRDQQPIKRIVVVRFELRHASRLCGSHGKLNEAAGLDRVGQPVQVCREFAQSHLDGDIPDLRSSRGTPSRPVPCVRAGEVPLLLAKSR